MPKNPTEFFSLNPEGSSKRTRMSNQTNDDALTEEVLDAIVTQQNQHTVNTLENMVAAMHLIIGSMAAGDNDTIEEQKRLLNIALKQFIQAPTDIQETLIGALHNAEGFEKIFNTIIAINNVNAPQPASEATQNNEGSANQRPFNP